MLISSATATDCGLKPGIASLIVSPVVARWPFLA
jgi:hypothetical protein